MKEKVYKLCKLNIPVILLNHLDSLVVTKYLIILELGNQLIPKFPKVLSIMVNTSFKS